MTWLPPPPVADRPAPSQARRLAVALSVAAAIGLAIAVVVALAVIGPRWVRINGAAMSPTINEGDRLLLRRIDGPVPRGTIVALQYPLDPTKQFVMRVVGLPGEQVAIVAGVVEIDGRAIAEPYILPERRSHDDYSPRQLGTDEYFVLGDNRTNANDSREWGPLAQRYLRHRMGVVVWRDRR
jgi:signal peptidase I